MLNILSNEIQQTNISCNFSGAKRAQTQPTEDCFIRSINLLKVISDEQKLQMLFNEVFDESVRIMSKINPDIKHLNLPKPNLIIEDYSTSEKGGTYNFSDNTISITKSLLDDTEYLVCTVDENGEVSSYIGMSSKKNSKLNLEKAKMINPNAQLLKLTDKERDIYIKAVFSHEIRHFIQNHLIASTTNCGEIQKKGLDECLEKLKEAQKKYIDACKECGVEPEADLIKSGNNYYQKYQPRQLLPEDTELKFSLFSDDKRYLSVKNHLLPSQLATNIGKGTSEFDDEYYSNTLEIDAYNFEKEYLYIQAANTIGTRETVILAFTIPPENSIRKGIELMQEKGVSFNTK